MDKIAIFRALYLGDMLLAVPALRALRRRFPQAEITLIGLPWAQAFVERYSHYLDRFLAFPGFPGLKEVKFDAERTRIFCAEARAYSYDLGVQMHGSGPASNEFIHELQAKESVGYVPGTQQQNASGLTLSALYPAGEHEIYRNLGLTTLLGCQEEEPRLEFPLFQQDLVEVEQLLHPLLARSTPLIGLHPGAKYASRRWPPEYFATLADELSSRLDAQIIFTGGDSERSLIERILRSLHTQAINLAGQTSLGGLAALINRLDLFISNDTGPAHLACALDIPSITIFGPAEYRRWAPLNSMRHLALRVPVPCSPCGYEVCPIDHRCLKRIDPQHVATLAAQHLAERTMPNEKLFLRR